MGWAGLLFVIRYYYHRRLQSIQGLISNINLITPASLRGVLDITIKPLFLSAPLRFPRNSRFTFL